METGRRMLFLALMVLLPISAVSIAQDKAATGVLPGPIPVVQTQVPITLPSGDYALASTILEFAPGAGLARHVHGGKVIAMILAGQLTLNEKGTERVVREGESWTEDPGNEHSVVNAGDVPVRVAVTMLLPKGAEATRLIQQ